MHLSPAVLELGYVLACLWLGGRALSLNRSIVIWTVIGLFCTPLFGMIILALLGPSGKACPKCHCHTDLLDRACHNCGRRFTIHEILFARLKDAGVKVEEP